MKQKLTETKLRSLIREEIGKTSGEKYIFTDSELSKAADIIETLAWKAYNPKVIKYEINYNKKENLDSFNKNDDGFYSTYIARISGLRGRNLAKKIGKALSIYSEKLGKEFDESRVKFLFESGGFDEEGDIVVNFLNGDIDKEDWHYDYGGGEYSEIWIPPSKSRIRTKRYD